ncbi:CGNR zinc finger domain-containing protein [Actinokineospora sp. HUAS TT18]|uniref:CGNR zinc finger domain-containing protein n=1 Tax=Actinokineospora sp. HUAS TT18 TaxID=3447451 RepID=UPI003F51C340
MDNADYLDVALRLANAELTDLPTLVETLREEPWWADRATDADLAALRPVAEALRSTLAAATDGDGETVLSGVNTLLEKHPPRPRVSGHTANPWHIHVADADAPPATEVAAAAAWGLAQGLVEYRLTQWGRCADCGNFFLDRSTNGTKRYCTTKCANRAHVAAFRSRHRG